jgi:hypothetical protein
MEKDAPPPSSASDAADSSPPHKKKMTGLLRGLHHPVEEQARRQERLLQKKKNMAKGAPPSSSSGPVSDPSSPPREKKQSGFLTRGLNHDEVLARRKSLKATLHSLPPGERSRVLSHLHGDAGRAADLSKSRIANLRRDDRNADTGNLTDYQVLSLRKRKAKPNAPLERSMHRREAKRLQNAMLAADAEDILRPHAAGAIELEDDMERTVQLTQRRMRHDPDMLPEGVARCIYDLELTDYGPYRLRYDRSGRHALLAGRGGHVGVVDQHTMALKTEFHLRGDTVRDACFLHNGSMMAVSQESNVYIYDDNGAEVHRLDGHRRVTAMEFLPYHWLLGEFAQRVIYYYLHARDVRLIVNVSCSV